MTEIDEYFPRGGKKPTFRDFKQTSNFLGNVEKGEKKKKKIKKKTEGDDGYLSDEVTREFEQSTKNCAVGLSYEIVKEGLLLLGRVSKVFDTKLLVSLPCRLQGTVMACHISEAYNKLLEAYVSDQLDSVRELNKMFRPGQYVALKVLEVQQSNLLLTMMPHHINSGKVHTDLMKGSLIQAAVSSIEDHGYVMEIGIPNTRAFLPKTNTNEEVELDTGIVIWCGVKSVTQAPDNSIVTLSNQLCALQQPARRKPSRGVGSLVPGTTLDFTVDKALGNGIEGHIFDGITSYIQQKHADTKGKKPTLGQRVHAHLLYEMPTRKTPFLTNRNIFKTTYPDLESEQKFKLGDVIDDAKVIKITRNSIVFRLSKHSIGTMSLKRIRLDDELTDEEVIAKSYPLGSEHKVRVLLYNLSDYTYSVSDQADALRAGFITLEQVEIGAVVDATVSDVRDTSLTLAVDKLTGYVPHSHMFESGVSDDPKKPNTKNVKKKFKVGQLVKARVLSVDAQCNRFVLTLKPSLLSEDLEILKSYEEAVVGKAYTGVIVNATPTYVLVSFFGRVIAYVPKNYVTKEHIDNLADAFHVGQIVKCTILKVDPENKKMNGSLTTAPFWPAQKSVKGGKRKQTSENTVPSKKSKSSEDDSEKENLAERKKKKDKKSSKEDTSDKIETKVTCDKKIKNKSDKKSMKAEQIPKTEDNIKKKTKKEKRKNKLNQDDSDIHNKMSEESDAIETDLPQDSDQILTPQDMFLLDMSDCIDKKKCKKRTVSLLKAIKARTRRLDVIEKKIAKIEEIGLTKDNKKYHTAMHQERLTVQERIKAFLKGLEEAQSKLRQFPAEEPIDYKKKKTKDSAKNDSEIPADTIDKKGKKRSKNAESDHEKDQVMKIKEKVKDIKVADSSSGLEIPSAKEFWLADVETLAKNAQNLDESNSSDEEDKEQSKKKRKKLSAAEKVSKAREEEQRLRELERQAVEGASRPRSVEQFERALLARPDCSELWIAYMALHLQATEIEKARAVGRKALATISFRQEDEKLNVWLAMLNFENRFGSKESQQKTLEEALQMNDTYKVHSKLLDIYADTAKIQELSALVDLMMRKYKRQPQTYIQCGAACYRMGLVDKARQVMQKAISVLEKKEHVSVLVQFALMERDNGDRERAETLFEQLVGAHPQRVDVGCVYADMLHKAGDMDRVRQVMERMTSHKLPARKMKVLYKKWIEIEEKIGDEKQIEVIRQKAMEFIKNAKF